MSVWSRIVDLAARAFDPEAEAPADLHGTEAPETEDDRSADALILIA